MLYVIFLRAYVVVPRRLRTHSLFDAIFRSLLHVHVVVTRASPKSVYSLKLKYPLVKIIVIRWNLVNRELAIGMSPLTGTIQMKR